MNFGLNPQSVLFLKIFSKPFQNGKMGLLFKCISLY